MRNAKITKTKTFTKRRLLLIVSVFLLLPAWHFTSTAQTAENPVAGDKTGVTSEPARGEQKQKQKQKEEQGDETAALKHSPSVQWLAKLTGLSVDTAYWVAVGINFAILAAFFGKLMASGLPKFFRARSETIRKGIEEASRASQEANTRLAAIEAKLARLDSEIEEMRAHAEAIGKQEEERILAANERDKQSILANAEQEIGAASSQLRRQLKQYAAQLAIEIAEQRISVSPASDRELVSEFAGRLGKDGQN